jgi:hypothetical protein
MRGPVSAEIGTVDDCNDAGEALRGGCLCLERRIPMRSLSSRTLRLFLFVAAILAGAAGVSYATGLATRDASPPVIHGCVKTVSGDLRVVDPSTTSCLASETAISWSQTGPPGLPGAKGDPGVVSSLDALNGVPCSLNGVTGQTMLLFTGPAIGASLTFSEQIQCVTADAREPNDTRASETSVAGFAYLSLFPAGDEDWLALSGAPFGISIVRQRTGADSPFNAPIHIEIYQDGDLVASGDNTLTYTPSPGHAYEVHVSGTGPALYLLQAF